MRMRGRFEFSRCRTCGRMTSRHGLSICDNKRELESAMGKSEAVQRVDIFRAVQFVNSLRLKRTLPAGSLLPKNFLTNIILSFELAVVVIELGDYDSRPVSHRHSNQSPKAAKSNGLAELKAASAQNKQNLATYTWQEQDTISVKGETKTQELFRVRVGPDGKPQKAAMNTNQPREQSRQADTGCRGRIKGRVIENKKEELKEYAQKIGALVRYAPPDPEKLQQAFRNGDVKLESGSAPVPSPAPLH